MYDKILKNAEVLNAEFQWEKTAIALEGDRIAAIGPELGEAREVLDCSGKRIVPGFVDLHIHGCAGSDTCDASREALEKMAAYLITKGVTSFCPTTMTISREGILATLKNVQACMERPPKGATIRGVNMEGPFIAQSRKGAQKSEYVRKPDWKEFVQLYEESGEIVRLVALAPECEGAEEFIRQVKDLCVISAAHTDADYETAIRAFDLGVSHVTHLFNAMTGMTHRTPGVVGAVLSRSDVRAEIICDGFHIHPAVLKIAFEVLGDERAVIISDSIRATGLPDGASELGGQTVYVKDGQARLADGTIAGSTTNMLQEVRNLISYGVPAERVFRSASLNPAKEIGCDAEIGSIAEGKLADLLVLDSNWELETVFSHGKKAYSN